MNSQREHFRIRYPDRYKPQLKAGEFTFAVHDLSEGGAYLDKTPVFQEGLSPQDISITFASGGEFSATAVFVRDNADGIAIRFSRLVPLGQILAEQRWLKHRFGHVD